MTALTIWLAVIGVADLVAAPGGSAPSRVRAILAVFVAGVLTIALLAGSGLEMGWHPSALVAIAVMLLVAAWFFGRSAANTPRGAATVLTLFGIVTLAVAATAPMWPTSNGGAILRWYEQQPYALVASGPERAVVATAAAIALISTANAVVRLALDSIKVDLSGPASPETKVRGGRLIGPIERLLIFALAITGEPTAAALIISAKGLLRYPELNRAQTTGGNGVDALTEYLLVGSLVSWSIALAPNNPPPVVATSPERRSATTSHATEIRWTPGEFRSYVRRHEVVTTPHAPRAQHT